MAAGNVNPFNVSDSEEEAEQTQDGADTERSPSDEAQGHSLGPFSPPAYSEPAVLLSSNRTSPGVDGIPASAAAVAGIGGGGAETRVSLDAIAAQLLRDQCILTALELHTELLEAGRELPRLRDYFSNPGNFERQSGTPPACKEQGVGPGGPLNRAGSISTLDSLDFARYSDDGNRESDEKVAVLEFELRKAKETIQALRANLTQAAECEIPSQERKNYKSSPEIQEPIRTLEKRALNFLVNEYLLKNEYKLTSITFSDENDDQDFELWDDVGLNIPKPPDLLQLYRNCGNSLPLHRDTVDVAVNVDPNDLPGDYFTQEPVQQTEAVQQQEVVQELEYQISLLNSEKQSLAEQIKKLQSDIQALQRNVSSEPTSAVKLIQSKEDTPCGKPPLDNGQYLDIRGVTEMDSSSDANTTKTSTTTTATTDCTESTTTATQPYNKLKSQQGKTSVQFDQPNRKLSPAFHQALLSFCQMSADSRLGSEVSRIADSEQSVMLMLGRCLPHIVPNVLLAKRERMVVHLCQELIPLILCTACLHPEPKERDQLLHILFNLIKRPDDEQRQMILTGCVAFARHVGPTRVEAELLPQCWEQVSSALIHTRHIIAFELCRHTLVSHTNQIVKTKFFLHPMNFFIYTSVIVFILFNTTVQQFEVSIFTCIEKLLKQGEYGLDEHKLHMYLSALQSLIPSLFAVLLQNAPFTSRAKLQGDVPPIEVTRFPRPASPLQDVATIVGSREQLAVLLQLFDNQLQHEGTTGWDSLLWVVNQFLPQLIDIVGRINVTSSTCVHEFSRFFWRLCRTFGKIFTNTKVKPQFQEILRLSEENVDASAGNGILTKATVPIYATGVLTCYNQEEDRKLLVGFLEDVMTTLSLSHAPLDSLKASFVELGANPVYHELLLTVLWYGVVHTSALVRCTAARMFELVLRGMSEALIDKRVAPALITLCSGPEFSVRISTIPAFGTIMETVTQKELLERVKMQLASFLEDPQYQDQHSLHMEIIKTFGRVGPNAEPRFRDEFVLPHLHKLALCNNQQTVESKRIDIATQLFEAYSALSCCFISEELMVNHFLPGLRCLRTDMEQLSPEHEVILSSMIKECEIKVENKGIGEAQGSISIAASLVGEDAKTKFLSKMGQLTTSGAMLANVFQRKK
uniref:LisH domain and HEAT repeat-containing protein KIAA1468 homolog n=1 Tax=Sinocyclocheilus rhinocerous TaxID=307959 RepID=A0A673HBZ6_9TELE